MLIGWYRLGCQLTPQPIGLFRQDDLQTFTQRSQCRSINLGVQLRLRVASLILEGFGSIGLVRLCERLYLIN